MQTHRAYRHDNKVSHQFSVHASWATFWLSMIAGLLVVASVAIQAYKIHTGHERLFGLTSLFNLDAEQSLPMFFSVCLHLIAATLLLGITLTESRSSGQDLMRWRLLTVGFAFMAIDEACSLHESLAVPIRAMMGPGPRGIFFFAWVIPAMGLVAVLAFYFVGFLRRLPAPTALAFIGGGILFLGGAIGVEMIGGWYSERHGENTQTYNLITAIEESLEMAGVIVFIRALINHAAYRMQTVGVQFIGTWTLAMSPRTSSASLAAARLAHGRGEAMSLHPR